MNAAQAMPKTGFKFMLAVNRGPDKGVSYQLLPPKVTIGRGTDNNVTLNDPRVSRQAAVIDFSMEKIVITDVSSRQGLTVNGDAVKEASLVDGDIIKLGDSELVFMVEAIPLAPPPPPARPAALRTEMMPVAPQSGMPTSPMHQPPPAAMGFDPAAMGYAPPPRPSSQASSDGAKKMRFYIILGLVLGLVVWLLNSETAKKAPEQGLKTVEEIQKDIEGTEKRTEEIAKRRTFKSDEEKTRYEEANRHYLEGFRDYQKGQYVRALRSFETARAIDPEHELARRYYKLAEKQRDEMIALLTLEGRRYKEKHMYSRCVAAFDKVLDAITNREDLKYKQAEAMRKECELMMDEKFQ